MNDSQFGGRLPIGAALLLPGSGNLLTMQDGSVWLLTGNLASAVNYPLAATVDHLKAHVLAARGTGGGFTAPVASLVTDGAGKYLASHVGTAAHSLSTDGGITWSTISTGVSGLGHALACGGGRWVAVNNDGSKIYFSSSATAASGSWAAQTSQGISAATGGVAKVVWSGTQFVASCGQNVGPCVFTSPDGVTWTPRPLTGGTLGTGIPLMAADGNRIVVLGSTLLSSVDGGASWVDVIPAGLTAGGPVHAIAGRFFVFGNIHITATDPGAVSNWSTVAPPVVISSPPNSAVACVSPDRSLLTLLSGGGQAGIWLTSDGMSWRNRAVDAAAVLGGVSVYAFGTNDMVVASTTLANPPYRGSTSPIGTPNAVGKLPLHSDTSGQLYVRIK